MGTSQSLTNGQGAQVTIDSLPGTGMSVPAKFPGFTRVSFSKNGRVHIESCCDQCNFRILEWRADFDKQERRHATDCSGRRSEKRSPALSFPFYLATSWRTLSDSAPVSRFAMLAEACASPSISPIQLVLTWVRCKRSAMTSAVISILLTVLRSEISHPPRPSLV